MDISAAVMDEIQRLFPEPERATVAELLSQCNSERLQLDVLRISKRKVENVRKWVAEAQRDYRDVITFAEYQRWRLYVLWILRKGPNWDGSIFGARHKAHFDFIREGKKSGKLLLGGQLLDEAESWMYIFLVDSIEEAREFAEADPAVHSGHFIYELRPWRALEGLRMVPLKDLPY